MASPGPIELLEARLTRAYLRLREALWPGSSTRSVNGRTPARSNLRPEERVAIDMFANSEALADRSRRVTFRAVDPRTGQRGEYTTSINQLLRIDAEYDSAKALGRGIINRLRDSGLITRERPMSLPAPRTGGIQTISAYSENDLLVVGCPYDTRMLTGAWADAPPFGGVGPAHIQKPYTALGFTPRASSVLNGAPLPKAWDKWYPTAKLMNRAEYGNDAFITDLDAMTRAIQSIKYGANANPELSPDCVCFNNGPQFPSRGYPPHLTHLEADVDGRHQYKSQHNWADLTKGATGTAAGFQMTGRLDPLWLQSAWHRTRAYLAVKKTPPFSNNWSNLHIADALADFMRFVNLLEFVLELGASGHVHAAAELHNALYRKARTELGIPPDQNAENYLMGLAREREARERRQRAQEDEGMIIPGASLGMSEMGNIILNGGVTASMQLFMVNPLVGGVALLVTAIGVLIAESLTGRVRQIPEDVPVSDGVAPVRTADENGDPRGDIFGGNKWPFTRAQALMGRPAIRVVTSDGRELQ